MTNRNLLTERRQRARTLGHRAAEWMTHHGQAVPGHFTGAYKSWTAMKKRCNNPNAANYYLYGGRGIRVCERWDRFENFFEDMGKRPVGRSLDRINVNGNYEPANCRWATASEQQHNRRLSYETH